VTAPVLARWAARVLDAEGNALPVDPSDRSRSIAALERALLERGQRRTRLRWVAGISLAASIALCAGLGALAMHGTPRTASTVATTATIPPGVASPSGDTVRIIGHVSGDGATIRSATASIKTGEPVVAGNRVVAHGTSHAILAFSTGTELSVEDEGDMTILEGGRSQVFALDTGAVRAHVAKLGAGERFVVHTPDAEVEVRGTSFRVAVAPSDPSCGGGSVTRVTVDEGVVVVRHAQVETRVGRGETWPAGCDAAQRPVAESSAGSQAAAPLGAPPNAPLTAPLNASLNATASAKDGPKDRRAAVNAASASSLADQNDAFAQALGLKHSGQDEAAITAFERFAAKYPSSNLAESAAVERMKLLLAIDHPRGVAAAAQYLRRYPGGFAQADANAAVAGVARVGGR
jgi:hypothetical protein